MTASEFDKKLKERLDTYSEAAPDVWEGIAAGLAARRRRVVFRRVSFAVAAAAACLAAALLLFRDPAPKAQPEAPVRTAQVQPAAPAQHAPAIEEIAPIAEQVVAFTQHRSVAVAPDIKVRETVTTKPAAVREPEPETESNPAGAPEVAGEPETVTAPETITEPEAVSQHETQQLGEEDLPADFWTREDPDEARPRKAHTSQISIMSNLTTVASEKDLMYRVGPNHSSSQSGSKQASSKFEPASGTAKFYSPVSLGLEFKTALANHLYIGSGLTYSYLVSQYDLLVNKELKKGAYNQLHYLGIPLTLSYNFVDTRALGVYASVGGAVEKCISQRYVYGSEAPHEKVSGFQWSAAAGIGVEWWFIPRLGIYFDPSLVYFFDNSQPLSIRTQQPLQARFEVGFRVKI